MAVLELSWDSPSRTSAATMRLLCIPYAGGTSAIFRGWADRLSDVALGFVHLPNRAPSRRAPADTTVADLATVLAATLTASGDERPCVLFGHSLGALIAFEAARRLAGWPALAGLMVSGRRPPPFAESLPPIGRLADAEFLVAMQDRFSAIPPAVLAEPDVVALLLPMLRADMAMAEGYRYEPGPPLRGPLFVYGGEDDPHAPAAQMPRWAGETSGLFDVRLFPGGHFFIHSARDALLEALARDLARLK
jgi:medium-chain acyl-[acyl-carrier-protein] hydrolase